MTDEEYVEITKDIPLVRLLRYIDKEDYDLIIKRSRLDECKYHLELSKSNRFSIRMGCYESQDLRTLLIEGLLYSVMYPYKDEPLNPNHEKEFLDIVRELKS